MTTRVTGIWRFVTTRVTGIWRPQESIVPGKFELGFWSPGIFTPGKIEFFGPRVFSPQGNLSWGFGGLASISETWGFLVFWDTLISWGIFPTNGGICLLLMLPEGDYNFPHFCHQTHGEITWSPLFKLLRVKFKKADLFFFELVQKRSYKIENYYPLSLSTYDSKIYNFLLNFVFCLLEPIFCKVPKLFTICWYQLKLLTLSFSR